MSRSDGGRAVADEDERRFDKLTVVHEEPSGDFGGEMEGDGFGWCNENFY